MQAYINNKMLCFFCSLFFSVVSNLWGKILLPNEAVCAVTAGLVILSS